MRTTPYDRILVQSPLAVYVSQSSGGSRIFERGVAHLTEQYRNNRRQSRLRDSFVHFLNSGLASHPIPSIRPLQNNNYVNVRVQLVCDSTENNFKQLFSKDRTCKNTYKTVQPIGNKTKTTPKANARCNLRVAIFRPNFFTHRQKACCTLWPIFTPKVQDEVVQLRISQQ